MFEVKHRSSIKVLVVDDTASQRYVRTKSIRAAGFEVIEAGLGHEALERAAEADVLVLDVFLPDIDGLEVCRILRSRPGTATMPIIHISSVFVTSSDAHGGKDAGANAYLIEPIPPDVLIQVIESTVAACGARPK